MPAGRTAWKAVFRFAGQLQQTITMKPPRLATLAALLLTTALTPAGDVPFPLWDGKETVADYAKRAHLDPTLTLDLGDAP